MKKIHIFETKGKVYENLEIELKKDRGMELTKYSKDEYEKSFENSPDVLVINDESFEKSELLELITKVRKDENNSVTPIIIISKNNDKEYIIELLENDVELVFKEQIDSRILYLSIKNLLRLLNSGKTLNPLTGLPGNIQIQSEMKKRMDKEKTFTMLYVDLDNFKAFNDIYGFSRGDKILKFTSKILFDNIITKFEDDLNFLGHIGGDDFIGIVESEDYEKICQDIILDFDENVKEFFDEEDLKKGFLEVDNRRGEPEAFPLTTISIGAVNVKKGKFHNTLEIGEAGASVKHLAKTIYGSAYAIDRREYRK